MTKRSFKHKGSCFYFINDSIHIKLEQTNPTWVENFRVFCEQYGPSLNMIGLTNTEVGVYIFLYTQKWFGDKSRFSAAEISNTLKGFTGILPEKFRTSFSAAAVGSSLQKLVFLGFVKACPNDNKESSGGRPANFLYETNKVKETQERSESELNTHIRKLKHALTPFSSMEEGFTMKGNKPAGMRDGKQ